MGKPKNIRKEDLVAAAKQQLVSAGQSKMTLKNVAETAGVTQGVVYYHFKTKDELLNALLQDFGDKNRSGKEKIAEKGQRSKGYLRSFLADELYKAKTGAADYSLLFELAALALHQRELRQIMGKAMKDKVQMMSEFAGGDAVKGRLLMAVLDGLALQALFDATFDEREIQEEIRKWMSQEERIKE